MAFLSAIPGPIFAKDVALSGRRISTYWIRGIYALLMLAAATIALLGTIADSWDSGASYRLQQFQSVSPILTIVVLWFQFIALPLVACALAGPTISEEVRAGTLGTLLTTPLKAYQIVIGKLSAVFVDLFVLSLIGVPLLLGIRIFGGTSISTVLGGACLMACTTLLAAVCGVFASAHSRRPIACMAVAVFLTVGLLFALPLLFVIIDSRFFRVPEGWYPITSSPISMGLLTVETMAGGRMPIAPTEAWLWCSAFTVAVSIVMIMLTTMRMRRIMTEDNRPLIRFPRLRKSPAVAVTAPAIPAGTPTDPSVSAAPPQVTPPKSASTRDRTSREVGDQPVLWRELRQAAIAKKSYFIALVLFIAFLLMLFYVSAGLGDHTVNFPIIVGATLISLVLAALGTAGSITGETESRSFDVLLATPLTARQIITGKFMGAIRRQWLVPTTVTLHMLLMVLAGSTNPLLIVLVLILMSGPIVFLAGTGSVLSVVCRRSAQAAVCNVALALFFWAIGPGGFLLVVGLLTRFSNPPDALLTLFGVMNPVAVMAVAIEGSEWGDGRYEVFNAGDVHGFTFTVICIVVSALYAGAGWFAATYAATLLAGRTQRSE